MTNVSDEALKNRVLMGSSINYLAEAGRNVKEMFDMEIILVSSAHEGRPGMYRF